MPSIDTNIIEKKIILKNISLICSDDLKKKIQS